MFRLSTIYLSFVLSSFVHGQILPEDAFDNIPDEYRVIIKSIEEPPCHQYANKKRQWGYACLGDDVLENKEQFLVYNNGQFLAVQFTVVPNTKSFCLLDIITHEKTYYQLCVRNILTDEAECSNTHKKSKKLLVKTLSFKRLSKFKKMIVEHFKRYQMEMCD